MAPDLSLYNYTLPSSLIAHSPSVPRDSCRLMFLDRNSKHISHHRFLELANLITPRSVLVFNQTKVFPARLFVTKATGGRVEVLFIHPLSGSWLALSSPRPRVGTVLYLNQKPILEVVQSDIKTGYIQLKPLIKTSLFNFLSRHGLTPLPPYIITQSPESLLRRQYQSIFAKALGSAAAPTASLHFTDRVLNGLCNKGVQTSFVTLHVGLGTFASLTEDNLSTGTLHAEPYTISPANMTKLNQFKTQGYKIIAVGTTTARCLESGAAGPGRLTKRQGETSLFIRPGYKFKFIDGLITNFHLPQSSLLMLVSAFVSDPNTIHPFKDFFSSSIGQAYFQAIARKYRFFSFGDACLIM